MFNTQFPVAVTVPSIFTDPPLQIVTSAVVIVAVGGTRFSPVERMSSLLAPSVGNNARQNSRLNKISLLLLLFKRGHMAFRVSRGVS